jgi:hypothetical protein
MRRGKIGFLVLAAGLTIGGTAFAVRHAETARLRAELAEQRGEEVKLARAQEEHARLLAGSLALEPLAAMGAEQTELIRLQHEIAWFRQAAEKPAPAPGPSVPIPAGAWKNVGRGTPAATLETALWAAAGGEVDQLASTLELDRGGKQMIEARFRALPLVSQEEYGPPERLAAYFTTKDVPLGTMEILEQKRTGPDDATMVVRLQAPDGKSKDVALALHQGDDGWRLKVPVAAMMNYLRIITRAASAPAAPPLVPSP